MALVKVQWKKPGEYALLDEKDLGNECSFTKDKKWHLFKELAVVEPELSPVESVSAPVETVTAVESTPKVRPRKRKAVVQTELPGGESGRNY